MSGTEGTEVREGAEGKDGGEVEVRWIDPDSWGFRAWSVLFSVAKLVDRTGVSASATAASPSADVRARWLGLARMLPVVLPCFTCRCCCAKFVGLHPPERQSATEWLCALRQEVADRNQADPTCNRLDQCIAKNMPKQTCDQQPVRFYKRASIASLWIMDVFVFLACVALTIDLQAHWLRFLSLLLPLLPLNLGFPPIPDDAHASSLTFKQAITWLLSAKACPSEIVKATIAVIVVKSRRFAPKDLPKCPQ